MTRFPYPYLDSQRKRTRSPSLGIQISGFPMGWKEKTDYVRVAHQNKKTPRRKERGAEAAQRKDHKQEEEQSEASSEDNPKGREGPEEPERRHVPGGMWLSQPSGTLGKKETTEDHYTASH
ncbi:hypothetical protein NDU88_007554 [Pleurodeles waltl]|uniref:Uncharacterized protein n=1 Tax=Pleurodeles waltl TaxID=8319 RepID=A0AAV7RT87_PLEWA|nr:hypothetical protein NDU88_007554 [Pleurodeles waltl]